MGKQSNDSFIKSIITIPWTTRAYFLAIITFFCLDYFNERWSYEHLTSNFFISVLATEVWRPLINFLYEPNAIIVFLILFHLGIFLPKFQRLNGSIITLYEIITIGYLVQFFVISYQAIIYLLMDSKYIQNWKVTYSIGAGGVLVNIFFKFLYFNFKQMERKCSKRAIFTYLYPLALVFLGSYLSQEYRVDMIAAYIVAFLECVCFKGGVIFYTPDTYTQKQKYIYFCRLPSIPFCNWSNLNEQKIKPNRLLVVQARQFYILRNYEQANHGSKVQLAEDGIQTQRGVFRGNNSVDDQINNQGRGQKWEKQEIIQDQ